jgi:LacI family transcriptional regulator
LPPLRRYIWRVIRSRVTLRDVARRARVHTSTASRALNPTTRDLITERIARRVDTAAKELGYQPNPNAYSLKTNRTRTVGVLIPDLANPVFPPILRGIEDVFAKAGYTAILANTDNDGEREGIVLRDMLARRVDGLILATARRRDPLVDRCLAQDIPLVLMNRTVDRGDVSCVVNDDAFGIGLAVAHMAALGHARIAHISGPLTLSTGFARHRGFVRALKKAGLGADPKRIGVCAGFTESEGKRSFLELRARDRNFTAVVAANDMLALGCYDAAAEIGLRIPQDISVTGFNDMPFLDKLHPALTTVRIPHYQMGTQAARTLLARLNGAGSAVEHVMLLPELIARGSTAPPASRSASGKRRPVR